MQSINRYLILSKTNDPFDGGDKIVVTDINLKDYYKDNNSLEVVKLPEKSNINYKKCIEEVIYFEDSSLYNKININF